MRRADLNDLPHVMKKLAWMLEKNPSNQMKYANLDICEHYVRTGIETGFCYYHAGYFIMVDVGGDWYTDKQYLIEQLILKIHPTTEPVSVAIRALDTIKVEKGCVAIAAGDTQVGYMTPHYIAAGYITLGTQLFKGD